MVETHVCAASVGASVLLLFVCAFHAPSTGFVFSLSVRDLDGLRTAHAGGDAAIEAAVEAENQVQSEEDKAGGAAGAQEGEAPSQDTQTDAAATSGNENKQDGEAGEQKQSGAEGEEEGRCRLIGAGAV